MQEISVASIQLTTDEYAKLKGTTVRYIRHLCEAKKIEAYEQLGTRSRGGKSYLIPLANLPDKEIRRYLKKHKMGELLKRSKEDVEKNINLSYESLSVKEKEELNLKNKVLDDWQKFKMDERARGVKTEEAMDSYIRVTNLAYTNLNLSKRTLYRWDRQRREEGEAKLVDKRGKHGNHKTVMTKELFDVFQYYYLDESRKSVSMCVKLTELEAKKQELEFERFPEARTFNEWKLKIPYAMRVYFRYGEKACKDKCLPYIHRVYDDLYSNDIWVSDNHTFDVIIEKDEKPLRVYLTGFLDVRSRKMMGYHVTLNPSADATLYALRKGIERYGVPKRILSDNGREFLTFDIGGRGFRKKGKASEFDPHTILDRLGIDFRTALVRNARAKIIERTFLTVKEEFSKLFNAYTGGNVLERPERLKGVTKDVSNLVGFADFESFVGHYIEGYYNCREHTGFGMNGMTPNEVYKKYLVEVRKASKEELNVMLMRSTRLQKVTRAGVKLKFYDKEVFFISEDLVVNHQREDVFVRYNPSDLSEVRVYDKDDRYILTAKQVEGLSYFASKEDIAAAMKELRSYEKLVKSYKKVTKIKSSEALDLIMSEADKNMEIEERLNPSIIKLLRSPDYELNELMIQKAVGSEYGYEESYNDIDWAIANKRIKESKQL